jgi:hypothetical protein
MTHIKFVVERHAEGFVAYPLGVEGVVVGEGDSATDALSDARSALAFHVATFGQELLRGLRVIDKMSKDYSAGEVRR